MPIGTTILFEVGPHITCGKDLASVLNVAPGAVGSRMLRATLALRTVEPIIRDSLVVHHTFFFFVNDSWLILKRL